MNEHNETKKKKETFYVIEQDENCSANISTIEAKDSEQALDMYESLGSGVFIILTEEDFGNMCLAYCTGK